ncbi:hypothetical protein CTEN210_00448 [Chaetoceros tenuissimus]|uniref:Ionotropic glutamate receptor C-terminal domain-containing protein n=1 Tax=Chaetoceros tenuissimus TaxID=426638 RepID=A0AAD3CE43_9STRA|nr:hypothetical protein CTEN210_00448 [Chaetoceros tenuissimus]
MKKIASFFPSIALCSFYTLVCVSADDLSNNDNFWTPNPNLAVDMFNYNTTKRQNFCALQNQLDDGQIELRDALFGLNLNVALLLDNKYVTYDENGNIDSRNPGLVVEILDEVSRRGGFTWQDSFASISKDEFRARTGDETWTDFLMWTISTYDISINWWSRTPERLTKGAVYPRGWYEGSFIIVTKLQGFFQSEFSAFSWSQPFTTNVWIGIIVTLLVTAFVALIVEGRSLKDLSKLAPWNGSYISLVVSYIYQMFLITTGHLDIMTRSHAGQLVSFSICLFALFIVSTYTANLASFLVIQKAASSEIVNSVGDIVKYGKSICVYGDTAANNEIRGQYPTASIVKRIDEKDVLMGLKGDDCDYGVMSLAAYELFRGQIDINGDCDLVRIGRNFRDLEDGFATISDAGTLCTSMIRDVINIHMQDMHDDGFIDKVWDEYYGSKHNIDDATCFDDSTSGGSSSSDGETLDFLNMGGIFLLHGATLVVAMLVYFYEAYMRKVGILKQHHSFETGGRLGARRHPDRKGSMEMMKMNEAETVRSDTSSLFELRKEVRDLSKAVNDITASLVNITNMLEKNQKHEIDDDDISLSESFTVNPTSPDLSIMKYSLSSSTTQSIKGEGKRMYDLSIISKV